MSDLITRSQPKQITWEVVVTRADGTVEDLGVVAYYNRNPLKRWAWALKKKAKTWRLS